MIEKIGLRILHQIDAEIAHNIALNYLKFRMFPSNQVKEYSKLKTQVSGIKLSNPLGLAAGFDKNGIALDAISKLGFGFIEIGAVTPLPQPGNPKPRAFRIKSENAIINHYGFNNDGMVKINERLAKFAKKSVVGLNIGANKKSIKMTSDFTKVLKHCAQNVHFASINISSPNTTNLRSLQRKEKLRELLSSVTECNNNLATPKPIFVKVSPDLEIKQLEDIVTLTTEYDLAGIIATNTTTDYQILKAPNRIYKGGISGKPLFGKSTEVLAQLAVLSEGKIPLIGVGGVSSAEDAFEKICAGASAIQLYSAIAFDGPKLLPKILKELNNLVSKAGFNNISEAVGIKKDIYAQIFGSI